MAEPSEELMKTARTALEQAMDWVIATGGLLPPFAMVIKDGETTVAEFPEDVDQGPVSARKHISESGASDAAIAWVGSISNDGIPVNAVLVEAFQAGDPESVVIAQRFWNWGRRRKKTALPFGSADVVARRESLL